MVVWPGGQRQQAVAGLILSDMTGKLSDAIRDAHAAADRESRAAAAAADVVVRELAGATECSAAAELLGKIWGTGANSAPITSDVLTSLRYAGGCLLGAFHGGALTGITVGVAGRPGSASLYSLIAGVDEAYAGRGVGRALKQAQRAWALAAGALQMAWTFDPLIRRNAHFNLTRLGARVTGYLPDFYPPMYDGLNRGDLTDRLMVTWDLVHPTPGTVDPGTVDPGTVYPGTVYPGAVRTVRVPPDIEAIRAADPELALRWRLGVREQMLALFAAGAQLAGFSADGRYLFRPGRADQAESR